MAKFRKVHTTFWDDPLMERLNPDARYFYLFLMTNPLCTECGIYQITIKKMCNYTGYNDDSIRALIKIFEVENSRVVYDASTEEICILKKPNYIENTGKPVVDCLNAEFLNVKNKNLILRQIQHIDRENVRRVYDAWHVAHIASSNKLGQEKEKEKEKEETVSPQIAIRGVVYSDVEDLLLKNQIEFERICMAIGKSAATAKRSLRSYHLFLEEKEQYPKTKKALFAGFEKWLTREKDDGRNNSGNEKRMVI